MSPRLSHRHLINTSNQTNLTVNSNNRNSNLLLARLTSNASNNTMNFAIVPSGNTINIGNPSTPNGSSQNLIQGSLINEKFCSWGSNSSANNSSVDVSTFDGQFRLLVIKRFAKYD